ncbi:MAG: rhomboid family intramembrane serine protease [Pseudomonadales bacterium]|nr:rhomboid family intramembrane serine protease [Pseudomonadales bacterium]
MIVFPWELDVAPEKSEIANFVIIGICAVVFIITFLDIIPTSILNLLILDGWNPIGLFTHPYLHGDLIHLIGNMLYLWVFGNAICSKLGSARYVVFYTLFAVSAACIHNFLDGSSAVGASAAVYGVIGFYFALFPTNSIRCVWTIVVRSGSFHLPAYLIIGFWVLGDLFGVFGGDSNIAHLAHLAGFVTGLIAGLVMLHRGSIIMFEYDKKTLPEILGI